MLEDSRKVVGRFQGLDRRRHGTELDVNKPDGESEGMMFNFAENGHPVFRATSALERGELKKQRKRKDIYSLQR